MVRNTTGFYFEETGQFITQPGVAVAVDDSELRRVEISSPGRLGILGISTGGVPGVVLDYQTPSRARAELRDGPLLEAVDRAFDPSTQQSGASTIAAIRVGAPTQSALALEDSVSTTVINLLSADYGLHNNFIEVQITAGTTVGKNVNVRKDNQVTFGEDLFNESFTLMYTGATTSAAVTVAFNVDHRELTTDIDGGGGLTIDLSEFSSIRELVNFLNSQTGYTAVIITLRPDDEDPSDLDHITAVDIDTIAGSVTATLKEIIDWFNSDESPFVEATRVIAEGTLPDDIPYTFMTGATEPAITPTDWQNAFDLLGEIDVSIFTVATGEIGIHTMGDTHAKFYSTFGKSERIQIVGAALGDTDVSDLLDRAQILNSDRTGLVAQGVIDFDRNRQIVTVPAYIVAAGVAGMFQGAPIGLPMTHKFVRAIGLETHYRSSELDTLLQGGVIPLEFKQGVGYWIVHSRFTWLINPLFNHVEISTALAVDTVKRTLRDALETEIVGQKATKDILNRVNSLVDSECRVLERGEIIVGDPPLNPAYKNIVSELDGDRISVSLEVSPVLPVNYVTVIVHAVPFRSRISTATAAA